MGTLARRIISLVFVILFTSSGGANDYLQPGQLPQRLPSTLHRLDSKLRQQIPQTDSFVYLIVYLPGLRLDLDSPGDLFASAINVVQLETITSHQLNNELFVGHFQVGWSCGHLGSRGATGQTGDQSLQSVRIFQNGGGLTALLVDYLDGFLESIWRVEQRLFALNNGLQIIAVPVSKDQCQRIPDFVTNYLNAGADQVFSVNKKPENLEGGVCWSFAKAAVSGVTSLDNLFLENVKHFGVPEFLLGDPGPPNNTLQIPDWMGYIDLEYVPLLRFAQQHWQGLPVTWDAPQTLNIPYKTFDFQNYTHQTQQLRDWLETKNDDLCQGWCERVKYHAQIIDFKLPQPGQSSVFLVRQ